MFETKGNLWFKKLAYTEKALRIYKFQTSSQGEFFFPQGSSDQNALPLAMTAGLASARFLLP